MKAWTLRCILLPTILYIIHSTYSKGKGVEAVTGRDGVSCTTTRAGRARILSIEIEHCTQYIMRTPYSAAVSILSANVKNGDNGVSYAQDSPQYSLAELEPRFLKHFKFQVCRSSSHQSIILYRLDELKLLRTSDCSSYILTKILCR